MELIRLTSGCLAKYTVPAGRGKETTLRAPIWDTLFTFPAPHTAPSGPIEGGTKTGKRGENCPKKTFSLQPLARCFLRELGTSETWLRPAKN